MICQPRLDVRFCYSVYVYMLHIKYHEMRKYNQEFGFNFGFTYTSRELMILKPSQNLEREPKNYEIKQIEQLRLRVVAEPAAKLNRIRFLQLVRMTLVKSKMRLTLILR